MAEKAVAVVSEYNPFHNGHFYQIKKIKEMFPGAAVISVMSGSLVQRGEVSLFSKYDRAEIAVSCGADAVFELPSVYSNAPANIFAQSAVWIMNKLSGIGHMCFGSECGDLGLLEFAAEKIMGADFESKLSEMIKTDRNQSYPAGVHRLFYSLYGEKKASVLLGSNNILAIEYLKALKKSDSPVIPFTIKRTGADFNSESADKTAVSAAYIRKFIKGGANLAPLEAFMPGPAYEAVSALVRNGKFTDMENLAPAVISQLSRLGAAEIAEAAEIGGGLEHRIKKALDGCFDYGSLVKRLCAKHITPSAARRAVLNAFFGITKQMQKTPPDFTAVLALGPGGARYIAEIRKKTKIAIAVKPADIKGSGTFEKNCFIDNTCKLALKNKSGEINEMRQKPRFI
ncbi:MAG: nucleotidyltransferase family protein [Oscillospiraceae bacterium]|nr:nucleotidyltransferase family protein [Oscillospiraceae bacterium]